jgi:hypothetical protein
MHTGFWGIVVMKNMPEQKLWVFAEYRSILLFNDLVLFPKRETLFSKQ